MGIAARADGAQDPLVSALMATYRRRDVLPRAMRSVLVQSVTDLELIVVDDEPSDETRRLVESFGDARIRYVAHDHNLGLSAARATGVAHARGRFVAFLDDDDEWEPKKLEAQLDAMHRHGDGVIVHSYERWVRPDGRQRIRSVRLEGDVHADLLDTDRVLMQTLLVPRRAFEEVGSFDPELSNYMDMDMAIRLSSRYRFVTVPEALFVGHVSPGSLSRHEAGRVRALSRILDKYPEYRSDRRLRSRWMTRLARKHGVLGDRSAWRAHLVEAIRLHPLNARAWLLLAVGTVAGAGTHHALSRRWGRIVGYLRQRKATASRP